MKIAPEGRPFAALGVGGFLMLAGLAVWQGGLWFVGMGLWLPITIWIPWFFRSPSVDGPRGDGLIIAPANGKVVSIKQVDEPTYLGVSATRVSIFMNVFDVHVNRHPVSGAVEHREYRPGRFVNATLDKASSDNERMSIGIASLHGRVLVTQIAGLIARRIVCDHTTGDQVKQGQRLGLIRFGSRVDTWVGPHARLRTKVGDRTVAGVTVLAEWQEGAA